MSRKGCNCLVVASAVVDSIIMTSGHLLYASTTNIHIFFLYGPAKSTWRRCHGLAGMSHWCKGTLVRLLAVSAQLVQAYTNDSICSSMDGHQTCSLAKDFIWLIPGWPSCSKHKLLLSVVVEYDS